MQKGNTLYYHGHINSNIDKLEERKDKFVQHRRGFLKEFCEPIKTKIEFIRSETNRYQMMKDTQEEVIENQPDIVALKQKVDTYKRTNNFFSNHVTEYQKKALEYQQYNVKLKQKIHQLKQYIYKMKRQGTFTLPSIHKIQNSRISESDNPQSHYLYRPTKNKVSTVDVNSNLTSLQQSRLKNKSQIKDNRVDKNRNYNHSYSISDSILKQEPIVEDYYRQNKKQFDLKNLRAQKVRLQMTEFNKIETLFRQCFEKKKNSIQKSVSQLQSKLIVHRDQFLTICKAIGNNQKISYEDFSILSSDQMMTLFISFSYLNRKILSEFVFKRKKIMSEIGKLPKIYNKI